MVNGGVRHPARFSSEVLDEFQIAIDEWAGQFGPSLGPRVLDPFAGVGGIHKLARCVTTGVEIEPEWAMEHAQTFCGDSRDMPFATHLFDIVATSPAYGNRMADQYVPPDSDLSKRYTYRLALGRDLTEGSGAGLHWQDGPAGDEYRELHSAVWIESDRVLKPGGWFLLNVKNHVRRGAEMQVAEWHVGELQRLGLELVSTKALTTSGIGHSPHRARFVERVFGFTKPLGGV